MSNTELVDAIVKESANAAAIEHSILHDLRAFYVAIHGAVIGPCAWRISCEDLYTGRVYRYDNDGKLIGPNFHQRALAWIASESR